MADNDKEGIALWLRRRASDSPDALCIIPAKLAGEIADCLDNLENNYNLAAKTSMVALEALLHIADNYEYDSSGSLARAALETIEKLAYANRNGKL